MPSLLCLISYIAPVLAARVSLHLLSPAVTKDQHQGSPPGGGFSVWHGIPPLKWTTGASLFVVLPPLLDPGWHSTTQAPGTWVPIIRDWRFQLLHMPIMSDQHFTAEQSCASFSHVPCHVGAEQAELDFDVLLAPPCHRPCYLGLVLTLRWWCSLCFCS